MMGMADHDSAEIDAEAPSEPELDREDAGRPPPEIISVLVGNHREFLAYVERRIGNRALAEEILQEAFVKSLDKADQIRDSAIGWFYRLLRNAVIDHQRRHTTAARRLEAFAAELETATEPSGDLRDAVCQCVARLAGTLKPEYATVLRRVEIDGVSVKDFAAEAGISSSNAGVRIFRAREALRKQVARSCGTCADHGCYQCTCATSTAQGCGSH
jgi:RNA polymerase sigma factor (sigma-70 family)